MKQYQVVLAFFGRVCLSSIFILSAFCDIIDWNSTEQYVYATFTSMVKAGNPNNSIIMVMEMMIPWLSIFFGTAIVLKLLGGFLVLSGWKVRFGALLLVFFLVPTTLFMHQFWITQGADKHMQMILFMKNISIFGGLLLILAFGRGAVKKNETPAKS